MKDRAKIVTVVGARPQFIKAGVVSRVIRNQYSSEFEELLIHTGQHYDHGMSDLFFEQLEIPEPTVHLGIGSGNHGAQTGEMLSSLEAEFLKFSPDAVMVYGDTNSTLAAALAASKIHIPVIHVEAGLRSFVKAMPEEVNRICTDHVASFLSCPNQTAIKNLKNEGIVDSEGNCKVDNPWVRFHGDVMYDNILYLQNRFGTESKLMTKHNLEENGFVLATIHRPSNTDNPKTLHSILESLQELANAHGLKIFLPLHPRTLKMAEQDLDPVFWNAFKNDARIVVHEPIGIIEIGQLLNKAKMVITDSGGLQKEAIFMNRPCIILRDETEWIELVKSGWGECVGSHPQKIKSAFTHLSKLTGKAPSLYGNGDAAELLCKDLISALNG